eukprot:2532685-Pyramimonas_sp.AAC.1
MNSPTRKLAHGRGANKVARNADKWPLRARTRRMINRARHPCTQPLKGAARLQCAPGGNAKTEGQECVTDQNPARAAPPKSHAHS